MPEQRSRPDALSLPLELAGPPAEDSGADTQDRFEWQHHCIAIDFFEMASDCNIDRIICEVHEDYIVVRGRYYELVSCKHLEPSQSPWNITTLGAKGGLAHLYSRWLSLPGSTARLMTNGGLKAGALEAGSLPAVCVEVADGRDFSGRNATMRAALAKSILAAGRKKVLAGIPRTKRNEAPTTEFEESVGEFMRNLTIKAGIAHRHHIRSFHVDELVKSKLGTLGCDESEAATAYENVLHVIAARNKANSIAGRYSQWVIGGLEGSAKREVEALLEARSLRRDALMRCCRGARHTGRSRSRSREGVLRKKLSTGGVQETRVEAAIMYRERWLREWAQIRSDLPGDSEDRTELELQLMDLAGDVQAKLSDSAPYGDQMYETVRAALNSENTGVEFPISLSSSAMFGAVLDLTARCKVWFSPRFEIDDRETA